MNYFQLFDIPIAIKIDKAQLSKKYFELQKKYHPDFFTQSSEDEQTEALEVSSAINKGIKTLQNEDETIKYVLQLKGLLADDEKYQLPPDFLMEMMELNENMSGDTETTIFQLKADLYGEVRSIIENYNDHTITNEELLNLKEYYFKKKYLQRILDRIED